MRMLNRQTILAHQYDRVPRYTSYPTAPQFRAAEDDRHYRARLADGLEGPVSLYLHVPYCRTLCWYCGCHTRATRTDAPVVRYAGALARELDQVGQIAAGAVRAGHVHWGGGTPTILPIPQFLAIAQRIERQFGRAASCETAIEIDPRTFTEDYANAFVDAGVNRVSIGVQSQDPAVQRAINRVQPLDVTHRAAGWLADRGIDRLNIDLVYGLPHQSVDSVVATVDAVAGLNPSRLSVFAYAHLPRLKRHQRLIDDAALPDGPARLDQALAIHDRLTALGYRPIGLDHYARPDDSMAIADAAGTLNRNFQGYTTDTHTTLLGFGASAIGAFDDLYVQNTPDIRTYLDAVSQGRLPIARQCLLTDDDRLRRAIINRLMTGMSVDLAAEAAAFGRPARAFAVERARLQRFADQGVVSIDGWRIAVAPAYRLLVRSVAAVFDRFLADGETRHATAV